MGIDLPLLWSIIIGFGLMMYVGMDGFDLGIGILFPYPRKCRTFPRERRHSRKNRYAWLGDLDSNQD